MGPKVKAAKEINSTSSRPTSDVMHKYSLLHIYPECRDSTSAFIQLKQEGPTSTDNILGGGEAPPLWLKAITLPIN